MKAIKTIIVVGFRENIIDQTMKIEVVEQNVPATDSCVMSIAPTQIHLAVSAPKATGSDC